jgi:hypothetical protein
MHKIRRITFTHSLLGPRSKFRAEPTSVVERMDSELERLSCLVHHQFQTLRSLKTQYASVCSAYYALAAASRRKDLSKTDRETMLRKLLPVRVKIERSIQDSFLSVTDVSAEAFRPRFFGISQKQGVSIRYPLLSCVPTLSCGGRCYAHDGRDRELHLIFRGALNYFIGKSYENGDAEQRRRVLERLQPIVLRGVGAALEDQNHAASLGFKRKPRIRFSHIGEMADTPEFANALAHQIKSLNRDVVCVVYTRHPKASCFDPALFVVNFTLEEDDEPRRRYVPAAARIVGSAWDGSIVLEADVNFLEHHVEKHSFASGSGNICPVTADHTNIPSCDAAKCALCFYAPRKKRRVT